MKLDLASLRKIVREELGRDPGKSTYEDLINEAGEAWVNAAEWSYLRDRFLDLDVTSEVESYRLKLGVRSVIRILRPDSIYSREVVLLDYDAFEAERSRYFARQGRQFNPIAATVHDQREGDDRKRVYLELFPVTITERLRIIVEAGWLPLDNSEDVADLPGSVATAFRGWLRTYALHREKPELYPMGTLEQFRQTGAWVDARRADASLSPKVYQRSSLTERNYQRSKARGHFGLYDRSDLFTRESLPSLGDR